MTEPLQPGEPPEPLLPEPPAEPVALPASEQVAPPLSSEPEATLESSWDSGHEAEPEPAPEPTQVPAPTPEPVPILEPALIPALAVEPEFVLIPEPVPTVDLPPTPEPVPTLDLPPTPEPEPEPEPTLPQQPDAAPVPTELELPAAPKGLLVPALAFVVVLLLALTGWLAYAVVDTNGPAPIEATRKAALDAGRDAARLVFSYDYRHLDKDFAAAEATTTGTFKKEYDNTTKKLVSDIAPGLKAVLLAEVSESGVVNASADRVLLLMFVDVQSTSTRSPTPKITPRRLRMTMQRKGDRWLVANIDAF